MSRVPYTRAVTAIASGFDGAVRRIATSYTNKGQRELITQYDAATAGSVVDEVKYEYERFGGLKSFRQDVNGAVDASGSVDDYSVAYQWAQSTGGRTSWRKTGAQLPSEKQIAYTYGTGIDDEVSRLTMMKDGSLRLASYEYLGYAQVVSQTYDIPDLYQDYSGSTSGSYPGFDRFGRVVESKWSRSLVGSDIDLYDTSLTYDRASNIVLAEDAIIPGRDVDYSMDDLDRLTRVQEGTWSGSAITSETTDEAWTLDHLGNWDAHTLDFNADDVYTGTGELDETRTHNVVNELEARDLDNNGTDDEALVYNATGEMTDDGADWKYVYDAFGRLRELKDQSGTLVTEYRYNGLGFQIAEHADTDGDSDVDSSDLWYYNAFDERWRKLATFRSSDTDPKEEFVPHQAGLDGAGGSSYINDMVLRDKDDSGPWTDASDGVLEQRMFYLNNWRGDVVAMVTSTGYQAEMVRYSAYGTPYGYPGGDCNEDGAATGADRTVIDGWISASTYDVRGDLDLDGDVDSTDSAVFASNYTGTTTGRGVLSAGGNEIGYAGMMWFESGRYLARHRWHDPELGRWGMRDPLGYVDWATLSRYANGSPLRFTDSAGREIDPESDPGVVAEGEKLAKCSPTFKFHWDELKSDGKLHKFSYGDLPSGTVGKTKVSAKKLPSGKVETDGNTSSTFSPPMQAGTLAHEVSHVADAGIASGSDPMDLDEWESLFKNGENHKGEEHAEEFSAEVGSQAAKCGKGVRVAKLGENRDPSEWDWVDNLPVEQLDHVLPLPE